MSTKNPIYSANLVLNMAKRYASDHFLTLSKEECEALEMTSRNIHRLERLFKVRK